MSLRVALENSDIKKSDPEKYDIMMQGLADGEKQVRDADRWYYQMFRTIAWGPTILINLIISAIFG